MWPVAAVWEKRVWDPHRRLLAQTLSFSWGKGDLMLIRVSSPTPEGKDEIMTVGQ